MIFQRLLTVERMCVHTLSATVFITTLSRSLKHEYTDLYKAKDNICYLYICLENYIWILEMVQG